MKRAGSAALGSLSRNDPAVPWQRAAQPASGLPRRLCLARRLTHGYPVSLGGEGGPTHHVKAMDSPQELGSPSLPLNTKLCADSAVCGGVEMNLLSPDP